MNLKTGYSWLGPFLSEKLLLALVLLGSQCFLQSASAQARPGPSNTGPTSSSLIPSGGITITEDNTVLDGYSFTGTVRVQANNVTIRNFKISCSGCFYGIQATYGATNLLIEDGEIEGVQSAGIFGGNLTARRLEIYNMGNDAFKPTGNAIIESNWIHHLGYIESSHADGIQMIGGSGLEVRHNFFDMPKGTEGYNNSICIIIQTHNPIDDVLIERNWFNGGGYSVQIRDKNRGHGPPTNARLLNNLFGRDFLFGPWATDGGPQIAGNRWEDTGELIEGQTELPPGTPPFQPEPPTETPEISPLSPRNFRLIGS